MQYVLDVQEDDNGELFLQLPDEMLKEVGWAEGDVITWKDNKDGSFSITKKMTELVLVDCINTFRTRYLVEVPIGKSVWALDTVTMGEAVEFSSEHIGENIVSYRAVSPEESLQICDSDNAYAEAWSSEKKMEVFSTPWTEDYYD